MLMLSVIFLSFLFLYHPDCRIVPNLILLKEPLLNSLNRRLLTSNIQIPFFQAVTKTFSVELGISQKISV